MILLLSRQDDGSTREVAEWLYSLGKDFVRINSDDNRNRFLNCDVNNMKFTMMIGNKTYTFNYGDIESAWYRRSGFSKETLVGEGKNFKKVFHGWSAFAKEHLEEEATVLFEFINYIIQSNPAIKKIRNVFHNSVNKMIVLSMAQKLGLEIPDSFIVTSKAELKSLLKKEPELVTKALGNGVYRFTKKYGYYSYTEKITDAYVSKLPDTFFPSLVQKEIEKDYELRIFYLNGVFYSMAIFSGEFTETSTDFRKNFNLDHSPRNVPYKLTKCIERKLSSLMNDLELNTGSIDMIVTPGNHFYFLEVNPVGQFGMISRPCNYYLEKKIAQTL